MLVSRLLSKLSILILFISFASARELSVYSYKKKANIPFKSLLSKELNNFLLIDENCPVCESLLQDEQIKTQKDLIFVVATEPSFSWLARLKRQGIDKVIYNIKSLRVRDPQKTPQILQFDEKGNQQLQLYGKSKIINFIQSKK